MLTIRDLITTDRAFLRVSTVVDPSVAESTRDKRRLADVMYLFGTTASSAEPSYVCQRTDDPERSRALCEQSFIVTTFAAASSHARTSRRSSTSYRIMATITRVDGGQVHAIVVNLPPHR